MNTDQIPMPAREPLANHDTYDLLDDALTALAQRRGLALGDEHAMIHLIASLIEQAKYCLPAEVATARANGAHWEQIACLLGTNAIEAQLTYNNVH